MNHVRKYTTTALKPPSMWKRLQGQRILKPTLLLIAFGSAAVNFNRENKQLEEIQTKFDKKLEILQDIKNRLEQGQKVDLEDELKLINKSFEYAGLGGSYFKGHLEKPVLPNEEEELSDLLKQVNKPLISNYIKKETVPVAKPAPAVTPTSPSAPVASPETGKSGEKLTLFL